MSKIKQYFKDTISELRKVTWPSKQETKNYTFLVITISLSTAIFLGSLDYIFTLGLEKLLSK